MSKLSALIAAERKDISNIYLFALFSGIIQLSLPLGVQAIIGFVLGGAFSSSLTILILFVILGVFFAGILQIHQMKIIERIQQKIFHHYAFLFKRNTVETDLKKSDNLYFPELMNRFLDVSTLQKSFSKVLLDIPLASIQILLGLVIVAIYHPFFLILIVFMLSVIIALFYITSRKGLETSIKESSSKFAVTDWLEEIARVVHVFKLNRVYDLHTRKMDDKVNKYLEYRTRHFNILIFQFKNLIFLKIIITAVMLILGTFLLINQQLNIGQFVAAELIIITMISSVEKIITNLDSYYDILTSLDKLHVTEYQPKESTAETNYQRHPAGMKLEFNQVSFGYDEQHPLFSHLNFGVQAGERIAISGKDGSGKSSLIRLCSTMYTPDNGTILYDDIPISNYNLEDLRSHIGLMFNRLDVFNGTIIDNITLGNPHISLQEVLKYAKRIGLDQFIITRDKGYDTEIDTVGKRLPRTVIKKILFLRAVLTAHPLIILEEPFSEVEENVRKEMENILLHDLPHSTIITVTNEPDYLQRVDRIFRLTDTGLQIQPNNR